jgi:uncharacterized protein (TIGR03435 family)
MSTGSQLTLSLALAASAVVAQTLQFDAASVKRADRCFMQNKIDPGILTLNGFPLTVALAEAYGVKMDQIAGPSWLEADCFSINARLPEGAARDQVPAMLQALLKERFKLAAHKESHPAPGYALVVDKSGPKMKPSDPDSPEIGKVAFGMGSSGMMKGSTRISVLVRTLSRSLHAPVEDLTGLEGPYDIDLSWTPDGVEDRQGPDIFTAVRESLGLRLEPRKEQVITLVIDHIERVPVEN